MTDASGAVCALVDWGTSRVRLWLVNASGEVVGETRSDAGMGRLKRRQFAGELERLLDEAVAPSGTGVMMCGMVGSRQGWEEAAYLPIPAPLADLAANAHRVDHAPRTVAILPGVADFSTETPDVIRGEETKLYGLVGTDDDVSSNLVVMPGTHAKWVHVNRSSQTIEAFATSLSGDLFAALGEASVLKHSVNADAVDPTHPAFADSVKQTLERPQRFLSRLFGVRARSILHGADIAAGNAALSGAVIGLDIAGAFDRLGRPEKVTLIGSGALGPLYERALEIAGLDCAVLDGDELVRHGLLAAARATWPDVFTADIAPSVGVAGHG